MATLEVCGQNNKYSIGENSNFTNQCGDPTICPPLNLNFNISSIVSYSTHIDKTVFVTEEGVAYGIGDNQNGSISFSLPLQIIDHFTKIKLKDDEGQILTPISAVCGEYYTLYLVSGNCKSGLNRLIYSNADFQTKSTAILNTGGKNPVSLFGGIFQCAAIDSEGAILFIHESLCNKPTKQLEQFFLPEGEKAVSVACCKDIIFSLSSNGRVFFSKSCCKLSFTEVPELKGKEIISISSIQEHCLAISKEGHVYAYGSNYYGQLGLGENIRNSTVFEEISLLHDYKIVSAYAGCSHSIFETSDGNFFACGSNDHYNLNLKIPSLKTYLPEISKIANASFIVAGFDSTCIFRNHVPKNGPNIRVVIHQESPEILSLRSKIKELENQLEEEKKKRKEELKKKKKDFKKQKEELEKMLEDRMNEINSLKKRRK